MILSTQLKRLLKQKDMTVAQLSRACGVSAKTLSDWLISKRNPRNLNHVKIVADYLGVTVDNLLFGTEMAKEANPYKLINEYTSLGQFEVVLRKIK